MAFGEMHSPLLGLQVARGKIANTPASDTDDLYVTVPHYSQSERWGPCPFAPRVDAAGAQVLPSRDDDCLVALDENELSYVVLWWPA